MRTGLLWDAQFRRFWAAGMVSSLGTGVGGVALPLTAESLGASAMDMGILNAAGQIPVLLLALHAGVWVDRLPRRPIMVITNTGRGLGLALIPLASLAGVLGLEVLWIVAFAVGVLAVVYDIAVTSYPPTLVPRNRLGDANSLLTATGSGAGIVGRGAAGWIVRAVGAPAAILVDAASFLAAAAVLSGLRAVEPPPTVERRGVRAEIAEGFSTVWRDGVLRAMVIATTIGSFGGAITNTVFVLFAIRTIGLSAPALGLVFSAGTVAGLLGALAAGRLAGRLHPGGTMVFGQMGVAAGGLLLFVTTRDAAGPFLLGVAQALFSGGLATFSVIQISLRQAITPGHVLGRVNAVRRVTVFGVIPVGALAGGYVGDTFGLRVALGVAAAIHVVALGVMIASPLRAAREPAASE